MASSQLYVAETRQHTNTNKWNKRFGIYLAVTDLAIISIVIFGAQFMRFGAEFQNVSLLRLGSADIRVTYTALSIILILGWMLALSLLGARDYRIVGSGFTEYKNIADATIRLFGITAITDLLLKIDLSRGYLLISFPSGLVLLWSSRWLWRRWLGRCEPRENACIELSL